MIYRTPEGHLSCREHPELRIEGALVADGELSLNAVLALGHLEMFHPELVEIARRISPGPAPS